jgi:HSP20 family protein
MPQFSFIPATDATDFAEDIRQLFEELATNLPPEQRATSGECRPAVDVLETGEHVAIVMDVAGVPLAAVRVAFREGVLLIVGEKAPAVGVQGRAYHLIERESGRFARAVRVSGAFDVGSASATLRDGELSIVLPKMNDRRGRIHRIRVQGASDRS